MSTAQQNVLNGRHVIRVNISADAYLYFTKEDGQLKSWLYTWFDESKKDEKFTGKLLSYSFQDSKLYAVVYQNGKTIRWGALETGESPIKQIASNKKTQSFFTGFFRALWCAITFRGWDDGTRAGFHGCTESSFWTGVSSGITGAVQAISYFVNDVFDGGPYSGDGGGGSLNNYFVQQGPYAPTAGSPGVAIGSATNVAPYGDDIWISKWVPEQNSNGCPTTYPNGEQQPVSTIHDDTSSGCNTGSSGHWEFVKIDENHVITNLINQAGVSDYNKQQYVINNPEVAGELYLYLTQQGSNTGTIDFINWAIDYLMTNSNVSLEVFKNQFMGTPEGEESSDYDETFWNDPNLTFPQQSLPSFQAFKSAYPGHKDVNLDKPNELYGLIGGRVLDIYNSDTRQNANTCAARLSRALLYSGVTIPHIINNGKEVTYLGADNKYYFMAAANMIARMKKTFGIPAGGNHINSSTAGKYGQNVGLLVAGKKGIYGMIPNDPSRNGFDATGHVDLMDGTCDGSCYFNAQGGIHEIFIWELH